MGVTLVLVLISGGLGTDNRAMTPRTRSAVRRSARALSHAMTARCDWLSCEATAARLADSRNPDGTVTVWYLCSGCAEIVKITSTSLRTTTPPRTSTLARMSPAGPMYAA